MSNQLYARIVNLLLSLVRGNGPNAEEAKAILKEMVIEL